MPVVRGDLLYVMSGHRDPALLAIRYKGAKGDLTGTEAVIWKMDKSTPYVPSPLLYEDVLYFLQKNSEILSCHDAKTGKQHFMERLEEINGVYASPVGAADHVYVTGRNGATYVLKRGAEFKIVGVNKLDDDFTASAAIVGDEMFLRGRKHLYCLGGK
jgi:outer membrane protein assembly factor BamB